MGEFQGRVGRDLKVQKRAYHNGYLARLNDQPRDANPHLLTYPVLAEKWIEGWIQADKDLEEGSKGGI